MPLWMNDSTTRRIWTALIGCNRLKKKFFFKGGHEVGGRCDGGGPGLRGGVGRGVNMIKMYLIPV